ncbi:MULTISPECIES: MoxR family ATPase [unclassified Beijerinckia]|uniref:AAA family ATPase n=1 Tax=unclassified Beijerinckia TaxID=2638183 RepID=UPI000894E709|nr:MULTISPECIES: MoxR family ATPase [unclassified Beijerinckia]MDH7799859.1 MoxR-like ATPase [Beijerinckia sp. GAS462]SED40105.1 MoxR-like ATPase [Beijerinckia sp. 28-YEA-48]
MTIAEDETKDEGSGSTARAAIADLQKRINQDIIGQERVVERLVVALLANGNVLLEGLPGLAKTRAIKSLSKNLESDFSRIQFTPDLLPSDVTGGEILRGDGQFEFRKGPVFGNLILADEINRAPPKVQSALLEAMEERHVTVAGKRYDLPDLFMVLATQNPIEQEGTYPLPEAQMDRFLMHIRIDYPSDADEVKVMRLVRSENVTASGQAAQPQPKIPQKAIFAARAEIDQVTTRNTVETYMVALIAATRRPAGFGDKLKNWISIGASPRGSLALDRCARTYAWMQGRTYVTPDDVQAIAHDCLRHRLSLSYEAGADGVTADGVLDEIVKQVAVAA